MRVTSRFDERFQQEHSFFLEYVQGISAKANRVCYTSLILSRLMFVYFIQKKGFLDQNVNYLPDKLRMMQQAGDRSFYGHFLLPLFHEALNMPRQARSSDLKALLGDVPYLNGRLFARHELENGQTPIQIADEAFEQLFAFFDSYRWQIDEQQLLHEDEITPDVIGSLFEKYINQKQMGAYYTQEDITAYMSKNTLIPHIFQATRQRCDAAFASDGPVWQRLRCSPERYIREAVRTTEYLPTETQREYQERRLRSDMLKNMLLSGEITSIDSFISCNLDIDLFAQEVMKTCKDSDLLRAFYESLATMTVLDPTCGSGAFLFAALHTLAPLYAACLDAMRSLVMQNDAQTPGSKANQRFFCDVLEQEARHIHRSFFILKAIAMQNLYGVDIMCDAVEICKLRLFLKLAAQIQSIQEIGLLYDLDFNIRVGNALVGFAHDHEVQEALAARTQSKLEQPLAPLEQEVQQIARELAQIHALQTQPDARRRQTSLLDRLQYLQTERGFTDQYGKDDMPDQHASEMTFAAWQRSHQPFHWCLDFQDSMQRGGFDVIIGNPPYIEYSKVRQDYKVSGYETESCGNLYAPVIERSLALCRSEQSYLGLIVPLSVCGGERFVQLRRTITRQSSSLWLSNFEIFPSRLFAGAFQRLSILVARYGTRPTCTIHVTRIQRWYASERSHLIDMIAYTPAQNAIRPEVFPKLASPQQETILQKLVQKAAGKTIATELHPHKTLYCVYYQEATNYWVKATYHVPFYKKNGVIMKPAHGRFLYFENETIARSIMALMNSSLFYLWFATFSDGFHLSHALVKEFPIGKDLYEQRELLQLALLLEEDIQVHARMSTRNTKPNMTLQKEGHLIELKAYRMGSSKALLDQIDHVLARYYGLSNAELDFIVNYEGKYRTYHI